MDIRGYGTAEAARRLGIPRRTLEGWRCKDHQRHGIHGPAWIVLPGSGHPQFHRVLYPAAALESWRQARDALALASLTDRLGHRPSPSKKGKSGMRKSH